KLMPAVIFASKFPRPYLAQSLFSNPLGLARSLFQSLFIPEAQPFITYMNYHGGKLGLHELEFGISIVPPLLILACLVAYRSREMPRHLLAWVGLAGLFMIPILGTFGNVAWGQILLQIPIINNYGVLTRWWSVYMLPLIVMAGLSFDRVAPRTWVRDLAFAVCVIIAAVQRVRLDFTYYTTDVGFPLYDPAPITAAIHRLLVDADSSPEITQLGPERGNDGLIVGISALPCYEPIFGYKYELFPAHGLKAGSVLSKGASVVNLADPRCYLSAGPNACRPGDQFRSGDREDVLSFAAHRPLSWRQPLWQFAARIASIVSLCLSIVALCFLGLRRISSARSWKSRAR